MSALKENFISAFGVPDADKAWNTVSCLDIFISGYTHLQYRQTTRKWY